MKSEDLLDVVDSLIRASPEREPEWDDPQDWDPAGNYWCTSCRQYVNYGGHPWTGGTGCGICGGTVSLVYDVTDRRIKDKDV